MKSYSNIDSITFTNAICIVSFSHRQQFFKVVSAHHYYKYRDRKITKFYKVGKVVKLFQNFLCKDIQHIKGEY